MTSTILKPATYMMEMIVAHLTSLIGRIVLTIQNSLVMEHVTIISDIKLSVIMMVLTVVSKDIAYKIFTFALYHLETNTMRATILESIHIYR